MSIILQCISNSVACSIVLAFTKKAIVVSVVEKKSFFLWQYGKYGLMQTLNHELRFLNFPLEGAI